MIAYMKLQPNCVIITWVISVTFKYILFDFDGTLIDTNELIILCLQETCKKFLNRELSEEDLNAILGKLLVDQFKYMSETMYEDMVEHYKQLYRQNHDKMIKEFPGAKNILMNLKKLGCKTAIVSAKGRNGIKRGLSFLGLDNYIDVIVSAYDVENSKPHPEPALKAINALGGTKDESLLVGDSPYDILCGKNAGIKTVLVDWTLFPKQNILALNPDFYIKSFEELAHIVK